MANLTRCGVDGRSALGHPERVPQLTRSARVIQCVLRRLGEEHAFLRICRVRAGHHQRSAGAWSWFAEDETGHEVVGSQWPVSAFTGQEAPASIHVNRAHQRELVPENTKKGS